MTSTSSLSTLDSVYSPNYLGYLTVVGLSYGVVDAEDVLSGAAKPIEATLSADGRSWAPVWHEGPSGEGVYVERWDATGVVFHGWVDVVSRRIVQAG